MVNRESKEKSRINSVSRYDLYYETSGEKGGKKVKYTKKKIDEIISIENIKYFVICKSGSEPYYERDEFLEGGYYEILLNQKEFKKHSIDQWLMIYFKIMEKHGMLRCVRFRFKKGEIKVDLWSQSQSNPVILKVLNKMINFLDIHKKVQYHLFYPPAVDKSGEVSMIEMRGKKVYLLRFGLVLTNFFFQRKIWWEIELLPIFQRYYKPNTNMIDVGANMGTHTLLMSDIISPSSLVFSFEPVYGDIVQRNIEANQLEDKVCLFRQGLGNRNETLEIKVFDRKRPYVFGKQSIVKQVEGMEIKKRIGVIRLDSLGLKNISVMKIDVEGMERDVLEGARETIRESSPAIVIEIWNEEMENFLNSEIGRFLIEELKYKLTPVSHSHLNHDYILVRERNK